MKQTFTTGQVPRFLIRHRKFGQAFARVDESSSIETLKAPHRAAKGNATCERFLGSSVRKEYLDQILNFREPFASVDQSIRRILQPSATAARNRAEEYEGTLTCLARDVMGQMGVEIS